MDNQELLDKIIAEENEKDLPKLWERQGYETDRMFGAFRFYANIPTVDRTLNTAYKAYLRSINKPTPKGTSTPASWRNWAYGMDSKGLPTPDAVPWAIRARAEDAYKEEILRRTQIERQALLRSREWDVAEKLIKRVEQMLAFPLARTETVTDKNGNPVQIIIEPVNWKEEDVARTFVAASKVARMSVDMPTSAVKLDWRKEIARNGVNPEEFFDNIVGEIEKQLEMADAPSD